MPYDPNLAYNMRVQQAQQAADSDYRKQLIQLQQSGNTQGLISLIQAGGNAIPDYLQPQQQPQGGLLGQLMGGGKEFNQTQQPVQSGSFGQLMGTNKQFNQPQGFGAGNYGLLGMLNPQLGANAMFFGMHAAPVNVPHIQTAVQPTGSLVGTFNDPTQNLQGFNNSATKLQGFNNPTMNYQGANNPALNMTGGSSVTAPKQSIQTGISMGK
ncbi:hypothetical protein [Burkholderia vietnamiensis]|uniref:hypothetical protein n=1 Tax=Burkholderia vietnamiensis TaxID=60552 RepID=UPI0018DD94B2|nr:hypothetical protein [Burkholderia vietnamiensis]